MDPENVGKEAIIKVTDWLRGIWEMRRKTGPVQQWVDSIPSPTKSAAEVQAGLQENPTPPLTPVSAKEAIFVKPNMTISTPIPVPSSPVITMTGVSSPSAHSRLVRDPSFQSDSSHCSSVESLLELRRADPEAILLGLGFGGCSNMSQENGPLSRIPKRFLQPSKLQGIAINDFVKHQQETSESLDSASLGYRGLTGSPYVAPSEIVQKIMERLREHESHEQDAYTVYNNNTEPYSPIFQDTSRLSVLSPDNRQFLERPRSKSPDMRNKRMIIGQKSFAFGCNGDLIEINRASTSNGNTDNHEIELDDTFVASGSMLKMDRDTTSTDWKIDQKSTMSNLKKEKKLFKQLSIDDNSPQDLNPLESNNSPGKFYSHSYEDSPSFLTNFETSRRRDRDNRCETRREASDDDDDDKTSRNHSPRRASYGSCDMKKTPWSKLSRDEGRRFSDGFIRQSTSLSNRRKSLKRQSRISDTEASQYCESDSCSDFVMTEAANERSESFQDNLPLLISEETELERDETDSRNNRSDRLSGMEKMMKSSSEKLSNIDVPSEINGNASLGDSIVKIDENSTKKKGNKQQGLSTILGMYSSVRSSRMEPGF